MHPTGPTPPACTVRFHRNNRSRKAHSQPPRTSAALAPSLPQGLCGVRRPHEHQGRLAQQTQQCQCDELVPSAWAGLPCSRPGSSGPPRAPPTAGLSANATLSKGLWPSTLTASESTTCDTRHAAQIGGYFQPPSDQVHRQAQRGGETAALCGCSATRLTLAARPPARPCAAPNELRHPTGPCRAGATWPALPCVERAHGGQLARGPSEAAALVSHAYLRLRRPARPTRGLRCPTWADLRQPQHKGRRFGHLL